MAKRLISALFFIVLFWQFTRVTNAGSPIDNYRSVFADWGFNTDILVPSLRDDKTSPLRIDPSDSNPYTLLILTSQLNRLPKDYLFTSTYPKAIVICDADYSASPHFECSKEQVTSNPQNLSVITNYTDKENLVLLNSEISKKHLIVVPQIYLLATVYSDALQDYFESIEVSYEVFDGKNQELDVMEYFGLNSFSLELALYIFIGFVLLVLGSSFLKQLTIKANVLISPKNYTPFIEKVLDSLRSMGVIYVHLCITSFILSIVLYFILSNGDKDFKSPEFIAQYVSSRLLFSGVINNFNTTVYVNSALLVASIVAYTFIVSAVLLLIRRGVYLVVLAYRYGLGTKQEIGNLFRILVGLALILLCYLGSSFDLVTNLPFILFILLFLLYANYQYCLNNQTVTATFPLWYKTLLLSICFLVVTVRVVTYQPFVQSHPLSQVRIVTLPIHFNKPGIYQSFIASPTFPIMANSYLIYHPDYKVIKNSFVKEFKSDVNFMILTKDPADLLKEIPRNTNLRSWLEENMQFEQSPMFFTSTLNHNFEKLFLEIDYKCVNPHNSQKYTLDIYSKESVEIYRQMSPLDVFNFPGCQAGDTDKFLIPMGVSYLPTGVLAFDLHANHYEPMVDILNVRLLKGEEVVKTYGLPVTAQRRIYLSNFSKVAKNDELSFYALDVLSEATIEYAQLDKVNLSDSINQLLKAHFLTPEFDLWTIQDGVVLKSLYN